ncbi:MAG: DUF599 family protein [Pseudomonadota bacterium]
MTNSSLFDVTAVTWFLFCWIGYAGYASRRARHVDCLMNARKAYLQRWMSSLTNRDVRIADATLLTILERNVTFFASTSMLILVGLLSALGYTAELASVIGNLSFAVQPEVELLQLKLGLLMISFIYAFFTFTWAMRQFNFAAMMVGGNATPGDSEEQRRSDAASSANVLSLAANSFNMGLRAYYFSLGALAWFIHPLLFMLSTVWVVMVLYRREFHSKTLLAMLGKLD